MLPKEYVDTTFSSNVTSEELDEEDKSGHDSSLSYDSEDSLKMDNR